jgi:hypothetical protein
MVPLSCFKAYNKHMAMGESPNMDMIEFQKKKERVFKEIQKMGRNFPTMTRHQPETQEVL